ncbi:hypothetical protein BKP37_18155 [Anaerobacillus alkalilacustris]|uniref:Uncharacterized protein n=1 Tax=Anaerobacillus alkalilacustris TaxID=393763 RepID=A0A1S2LDK7_9BACI|nr:hypothetical protein [Anaerobacillus alkalilacustris]OIJ10461.1 hypothetical protein BKP37_18155 [Anaerobacillus alkalilacustris]
MLEVILTYKGFQPIFETLRGLQFKYNEGVYVLDEQTTNYTATIINDTSNDQLKLQFSKELSFEQYKHLHKIIKIIVESIQAKVDDHQALMGYLDNGNEAYIYHGWSAWVQFLEGAKHVSMEGQKVQVYENQLLLGEGILVESTKAESTNDDFYITECKLITHNGEQTFTGEQLKIIAIGEF